MKNIYFKAKLFKLNIRGCASYENLKKYAEKSGYRIAFIGTTLGEELLAKHKITVHKKAFTYICGQTQIIFIDRGLGVEEIRLLLLHEIAHIKLKHLQREILNNTAAEIEADAFTYYVLKKLPLRLILLMVLLVLLTIIFFATNITKNEEGLNTSPAATSTTAVTGTLSPDHYTSVYVTPHGDKYHRRECIHIKNSIAKELLLSEAEKLYTPCKTCIP